VFAGSEPKFKIKGQMQTINEAIAIAGQYFKSLLLCNNLLKPNIQRLSLWKGPSASSMSTQHK
jgi:hypothetical protein